MESRFGLVDEYYEKTLRKGLEPVNAVEE